MKTIYNDFERTKLIDEVVKSNNRKIPIKIIRARTGAPLTLIKHIIKNY